jgi:hypothetical protein
MKYNKAEVPTTAPTEAVKWSMMMMLMMMIGGLRGSGIFV